MMTRIERSTATMARLLPRRLAMRPIPGTEEGIGSAGHHGGLAEDAGLVSDYRALSNGEALPSRLVYDETLMTVHERITRDPN